MLRDVLQDEGYMVLLARNGQEGFERARELRPQLILTDLMMPVMDGRTLGRHLRAEPRTAQIPLIVMSAAYRPQDGDAFDAVLAKPFDILPVLDLIRAHLGDSS
jgi:CheY-like chemotaxis protein